MRSVYFAAAGLFTAEERTNGDERRTSHRLHESNQAAECAEYADTFLYAHVGASRRRQLNKLPAQPTCSGAALRAAGWDGDARRRTPHAAKALVSADPHPIRERP